MPGRLTAFARPRKMSLALSHAGHHPFPKHPRTRTCTHTNPPSNKQTTKQRVTRKEVAKAGAQGAQQVMTALHEPAWDVRAQQGELVLCSPPSSRRGGGGAARG